MLRSLPTQIATLGALRHPNIIQLYGITSPESTENSSDLYMVSEFCAGGDLLAYMKSPFFQEVEEFVRVILEILSGIVYLHGCGIAHRDLKPANVLILTGKGGGTVKLADFGLAKSQQSCKTVGLGTPAYMAPELFQEDDGDIDAFKTDIYSCAVIIFQLWHKESPWGSMSPHKIMSKVIQAKRPTATTLAPPPALKQVIEDCWAQTPKARPSAHEAYATFNSAVKVELHAGDDPHFQSMCAAEDLGPTIVSPAADPTVKVELNTGDDPHFQSPEIVSPTADPTMLLSKATSLLSQRMDTQEKGADFFFLFDTSNPQAKVIAASIIGDLEDKGHSCGLSNNIEGSSDDDYLRIINAGCVLVIITDTLKGATLKYESVLRALKRAVDNDITVLPIVAAEDWQRLDDMMAVVPEEIAVIASNGFVDVDVSDVYTRKISISKILTLHKTFVVAKSEADAAARWMRGNSSATKSLRKSRALRPSCADDDGFDDDEFDDDEESAFKFFICHPAGPIESVASKLADDLEAKGFKCQLASMIRTGNTREQKRLVEDAESVIALLNDDQREGFSFFEQPDCVQELEWAADAEVPIIPITAPTKGPSRPVDELLAKAPESLIVSLAGLTFVTLGKAGDIYGYKLGIAKIIEARNKFDEEREGAEAAKSRWKKLRETIAMSGRNFQFRQSAHARASIYSRASVSSASWDFFICHANGPIAESIAHNLATKLSEKGLRCCVGASQRSDRSQAKRTVLASACILAVITDDSRKGFSFFEQSDCKAELEWAIEHEVYIQPLVTSTNKEILEQLMAKAPDEIVGALGTSDTLFLDPKCVYNIKMNISLLTKLRKQLSDEREQEKHADQLDLEFGSDDDDEEDPGPAEDALDFYISHGNGGGQDLAFALKKDLEAKGCTCAVSGAPGSTKVDKRRRARAASFLVAVVTGESKTTGKGFSYFSRADCVQEVRWAMERGAQLLPVISGADKGRVDEFLTAAPSDLVENFKAAKINVLDLADVYLWKMGVSKIVANKAAAVASAKAAAKVKVKAAEHGPQQEEASTSNASGSAEKPQDGSRVYL